MLPSVDYNSNGEFKFLAYDSAGNPTGFHSPCDPIRYEVNPENEPEGAREILEAAFQSMRYYTGLEFEFVGNTDELVQPNEPIPIVNPPSTLLINYFPTEKMKSLTWDEEYEHVDDAAGWGGPRSYKDLNPGKKQYQALGGVMVLDSDFLADDLLRGLWGEPRGKEAFSLMIHELGHVVGLDHVDAISQIMHFGGSGIHEFQSGDQEGLAIAGRGACGADVLGNLAFGEEPAGTFDAGIPNSCVVKDLTDTHTMFETRQESSPSNLTCQINPFANESGYEGLSVNYSLSKMPAEQLLEERLAEFSLSENSATIRESRKFGTLNCEVLAVYSNDSEASPLYFLEIVCGDKVIGIRGSNLMPSRYFESPTLNSIIRHHAST